MITVGTYEAKTQLPKLLRHVANGETVLITKHGKPLARLVPAEMEIDRDKVRHAVDKLREFSKGHTLGGYTIQKLRDEGRR